MKTVIYKQKLILFMLLAVTYAVLCNANISFAEEKSERKIMNFEELKRKLSPESYKVLCEEATEAPFSSPLNYEKREGKYVCAACGNILFESATKYDSGSGWPSFYDAKEGSIGTKIDNSLGMTRTEYHCAKCGGHLGHIFEDGPKPTGLRYCNNGAALKFIPKETE